RSLAWDREMPQSSAASPIRLSSTEAPYTCISSASRRVPALHKSFKRPRHLEAPLLHRPEPQPAALPKCTPARSTTTTSLVRSKTASCMFAGVATPARAQRFTGSALTALGSCYARLLVDAPWRLG